MPHDLEKEPNKEDLRATWKDILAMIIAAYQVLLVPLGMIILAVGGVVLLFYLFFRVR